MKFSERHGYVEVRTAIQRESMDPLLRTDLWNVTKIVHDAVTTYTTYTSESALCRGIWQNLWRENADEIPYQPSRFGKVLKAQIHNSEWFAVYDLIEYIAENIEDGRLRLEAVEAYNNALARNLAGYRIVNFKITPVDSETDVLAIEDGLRDSEPLAGARHHLNQALSLLSDRTKPDYANSMKESISAVEATCNAITGKRTLGEALKHLKDSGMQLHPALETAWSKMYGYTSDEDGIRHFATDQPKVDQAQAKYFLITCSAFVSLLLAEAAKAGIKVK